MAYSTLLMNTVHFKLQADYLHMYSTSPSSKFLSSYHNCLLVSGGVTSEQQDFVIKKLAESKHVGPSVIR